MANADVRKKIIQERREREKNQRIQSIIESAKKLFFSKGYLKTTMDEIALGAEISKPTIYQYFKTKDDLFFSLMIPVIEDIGRELEKVERALSKWEIKDDADIISRIFAALYHCYETLPETFRIVQLFQQQGLVAELNPGTRSMLNEKGRRNFDLCRGIISMGIEKGMIAEVNVHELADLIWGTTVGVIQLEDIKNDDKRGNRFKKSTLKLAEDTIINSLTRKAGAKPATRK